MNKTKSSIKINGHRFDAVTGELLILSPARPVVAHHVAKKVTPVHRPVVSGRKPANHAVSHAPQRAKTLMRPLVKKPAPALKRQLHVQAQLDTPSHALLTSTPELVRIDAAKLQHAKHVPKSKFISRFGAPVRYGRSVAAVMTPHRSKSSAAQAAPKTMNELLQVAVERAKSHEQPAPKHTRRRLHIK